MSKGASESTSRQYRPRFARAKRQIEAAKGYLTLGMAEHALGELKAAPSTSQFKREKLRIQAEALYALGRFADALSTYTRALAERQDSLPILLGIAYCYQQLDRTDCAIAAMEEANRFHPNEPAVLLTLSRLYISAGQTQRSLSWLSRALRVCPEVAEIAEQDAAFASLRSDAQFLRLIEAAQFRRAA